MMLEKTSDTIPGRMMAISLPFLIFLTGFIHVKLYIKIAAIVLFACYLLFRRFLPGGKLIFPVWFYLLMIPLGLLSAWMNGAFSFPDYWRGFGISAIKWLTAGAGLYLISLALKHLSHVRQIATIKAFLLLNAVVSLADLVYAMSRSGRWMPYWINDSTEFGISTGDYIQGLSRDSSVTNAAINLGGVLFFLFRKDLKWALLCLFIALLCTSNFSVLLLLVCLATTIIWIRDRRVKMYAGICVCCTIALYSFLSMQNIFYANRKINKEISDIKTGHKNKMEAVHMSHRYHVAEKKDGDRKKGQTGGMTGREYVVQELKMLHGVMNSYPVSGLDTGVARHVMLSWYSERYDSSQLAVSGTPGKLYALEQTASYMAGSPRSLLFGSGPGNFSSNLAIKMTGLGIHGSYPADHIYVHNDFLDYHLYIWVYVYAHTEEFHSVTQLPANVYSQLGGEYGLSGLGLFAILYIGYFLRLHRNNRPAIILIGMLLGYFFVDYWFEMISLTVFFEMLMLAGPVQEKEGVP